MLTEDILRQTTTPALVKATLTVHALNVTPTVYVLSFLFVLRIANKAGGRSGTSESGGPAHSTRGNRLHADTASRQGFSTCGS